MLEHDPEKWEPVFGKRSCSNEEVERDDDSKNNHPALLFDRHGAALSLIEQNKFKKGELRGRACIPVHVHGAWFHQQRFAGLERNRLFSIILNNHLSIENIKDDLARVV